MWGGLLAHAYVYYSIVKFASKQTKSAALDCALYYIIV